MGRLFLQNCSQCHGSDARGGRGFSEPDRQRMAMGRPLTRSRPPSWAVVRIMAAWGEILGQDGVKGLPPYVLSLRSQG